MGCCFHQERVWPFSRLESGCQFPDAELTEMDGQTYCEFHLPMAGEDGTASPKAEWAWDQADAFNEKVFSRIDLTAEGEAADLTGVVFPAAVDFASMEALPTICFQNAAFGGPATFGKVVFNGVASFIAATFSENAYFHEAVFTDEAHFTEARFSDYAFFGEAEFRDMAEFSNATFGGDAYCHQVVFDKSASFRQATFREGAYFPGGDWGSSFSYCFFTGAQFLGAADFSDRTFNMRTRFDDALFTMAPKFYRSTLHPDTLFPQAVNFLDRQSEHAPGAYRTLKRAMGEFQANREQGMFFALEQKSERHRMSWGAFDKWLSFAYAGLSGYGQRASWPLLWLAVFNLGCAGLYKVWGTCPWTLLAVQVIGSLGLIGLFLLAVRGRFKAR